MLKMAYNNFKFVIYYNCSWQVISKKDFMLLDFVEV